MISITIPKGRAFDSRKNIFYEVEKDTTIQLEHSLISIQKWESKWHIPFLDTKDKTLDQMVDYVRCMCLTKNVNPDVFYCIPKDEMIRLSEYIEDPMTATWFNYGRPGSRSRPGKKQVVTAEIIYYMMISYNIPSEYKKWHLNQLLTLIHVFNVKNESVNKKRSKRDILQDYKAINEANKKKYGTEG